jgi:hypothetical protein
MNSSQGFDLTGNGTGSKNIQSDGQLFSGYVSHSFPSSTRADSWNFQTSGNGQESVSKGNIGKVCSTASYFSPAYSDEGTFATTHNEDLKMRDYTNRLNTFINFPTQPFGPRPSELAALGLYYLGISDKTRCFSCKTVFHNWETSDLVLNEHFRWSLGRCGYLNHVMNYK